MIKSVKSNLLGKLNIEVYTSANQLVDDLQTRKRTSTQFKSDEYERPHWVGGTREQVYTMLREGYQPTVDRMKDALRFTTKGVGKRTQFFNHVEGFAPVVPNAILGLPNSMVASRTKPLKNKVIDVYYDMTCNYGTSCKKLIEAGEKMIGTIMELEAQGYRFNLYTVQGYYGNGSCDMLVLRVKSANQPFDLKRMSFPLAHTGFFRGIGFEWYSKFPLGEYRFGYGKAIAYEKSQEELTAEFRKLFGPSVVYFAATKIMKEDKDYLKGVLTNGKVD